MDNFGSRAPRAVNILEEGFDDAVAVLNLPEQYRKRLRTTNGIERLNEEVRRREKVIRIFPSAESAERLLGALLMEKDEAWSTGRQYFDMRAYVLHRYIIRTSLDIQRRLMRRFYTSISMNLQTIPSNLRYSGLSPECRSDEGTADPIPLPSPAPFPLFRDKIHVRWQHGTEIQEA